MEGPVLLVLSLVLAFALRSFIEFRKAVRAVHNHPGYRLLFNTLGPKENFFPRIPGVFAGCFHMFHRKHLDFELHGWDVITYVSAFWGAKTNFYVADVDAVKEITTYRSRFPKPLEQYQLLTFFGDNIVATEGDEWKRYRKITAPAFSERNNKLVWDETIRILQELFEQQWGSQDVITYQHAVDLTLPIALFVIGIAGFGQRVSWKEDRTIPPGHKMTFKDSLHVVAYGVFTRLVVPNWILSLHLTEHHRLVHTAFNELEVYMHEMIRERRESEKKEERYDLFNSLLDANEMEEPGSEKLLDSELIGNTFLFLLAGHETTAHSLCYAFALLALHPEEQEKLYDESKQVMQDGNVPAYEDINSYTYSLAVLYETLRMFPPVQTIPKRVAEDTTITISNAAGETTTIPMPQGSNISLHTPGLHYNPRYWKDPHKFDPSRFLGDWNKDAFLPFSAGPRACMGRRFNETESIAVLTLMVLNYKIGIPEEPQFAQETKSQRAERILRSKPAVTMTPLRMPLTFTKRS